MKSVEKLNIVGFKGKPSFIEVTYFKEYEAMAKNMKMCVDQLSQDIIKRNSTNLICNAVHHVVDAKEICTCMLNDSKYKTKRDEIFIGVDVPSMSQIYNNIISVIRKLTTKNVCVSCIAFTEMIMTLADIKEPGIADPNERLKNNFYFMLNKKL